jgi:hypothetical protein
MLFSGLDSLSPPAYCMRRNLIMNNELLTMVEREVLGWPGVTSEPERFSARDSDHPWILQPAGETTTIKGGN